MALCKKILKILVRIFEKPVIEHEKVCFYLDPNSNPSKNRPKKKGNGFGRH
jgi:hypothetical protein